jgi:L-iditol 2-dehydrogenase
VKLAELRGPREFVVVDVPVPEISADEVLVRVAGCGVCSSELGAWTGRVPTAYPVRIGHEVSGEVVSVGGSVRGFAPGDRVAVWTVSSGYAEFVAVRADYCRLVGQVPLEQALAEPLACASNAVELADVRLGDDVVVVGAGFMGLLVLQLAALRGPRQVIVADTRSDVLALAAQLGATRTVDTREESLSDVVAELTGGAGADVTFEVTGSQSALDLVGDVTRMSGKIALVGYHQGESRSVPMSQWNWMAFSILNCHFREVATILRGMSVGVRLLRSGHLRLDLLVTHRLPLEAVNDACVPTG